MRRLSGRGERNEVEDKQRNEHTREYASQSYIGILYLGRVYCI